MEQEAEFLASLGISATDWQQTPVTVRAVVVELASLRSVVQALTERVRELEDQLKKNGSNSSNSSMPPSSDRPWNKPLKKKRESSGKSPGAQPGHVGRHRPLFASNEVNHVVDYSAQHCQDCGTALSDDDALGEARRHHVAELPPMEPVITEHRATDRRCRQCGQINRKQLPEQQTQSAFGPNVHAHVGIFASRFHLSRGGIQECMEQLFGLSICVGTIQRMLENIGSVLKTPYDEALRAVREARVRHFDETTWYIKNRRGYLWVGTCAQATAFRIAATRGQVVLREWIGEEALRNGHSISDRYSGYNLIPMEQRGICHAHLRRDFQSLKEELGFVGIIGSALVTQHEAFFGILHEHEAGKLDTIARDARVEPIKAEVQRLLRFGAECGNGMCANLLKHWSAMWAFLNVPGMEATNNAAERAVRPLVLLRKRSLGTRNTAGTLFTERAQTVIATCRQNGRSAVAYLRDTIEAWIAGGTAPPLLPVPAG